jgi:hypothetical protein
MAMAAMIRMIATTISSSINEKPFCLRILEISLPSGIQFVGKFASIHWQIEPANCWLYVHVVRQLTLTIKKFTQVIDRYRAFDTTYKAVWDFRSLFYQKVTKIVVAE